MDFPTFLEKVTTYSLEFLHIYLGVYRGFVIRNDDPEGRGRIQVEVPKVHRRGQGPDVWVDPAFAGAGVQRGWFWPPHVGDSVRIQFERGQARKPIIYFGGWFGTADVPTEFGYSTENTPEKRGVVTRAGHTFQFTDEPDAESIRLIWHKPVAGDTALSDRTASADRLQGDNSFLSFEPDGSIQLVNKNGTVIALDASNENIFIADQNGNIISTDSEGVKLVDKTGGQVNLLDGQVQVTGQNVVHVIGQTVNVKAGGIFLGEGANASAVFGEQLLRYLNSHTHTSGVGPTGPPIQPATPELTSKKVKVA